MKKENQKNLFKTMQAIGRAKLNAEYNKRSKAVRIDSRIPKQMGFLTKFNFRTSVKALERKGLIDIESIPSKDNEAYQKHFQLKPRVGFEKLYKQLERKFPEMQEAPPTDKTMTCAGLKFNPKTGKFSYGKVSGIMKPNTAPWSILYFLLKNKNKFVEREKIKSAIMAGWSKMPGKLSERGEPKTDLESQIKLIRRKLKMGQTKKAKNKNIIEPDGQRKSYRIKCR